MLNSLAEWLLLSSALSPAIFGIGLRHFMECSWTVAIICIIVAAISVLLCHFVLKCVSDNGEKFNIRIRQIERRDSVVLGFLATYALSLLRFEGNDDLIITSYVFLIVMLGLRHSGAYHFNPVMAYIFRYHFYSVRTSSGMERVIITKTPLTHLPATLSAVRLNASVALCASSHDS